MKLVDEFVVPWVRQSESYSDTHMDFAWSHPDVARMMSNENPLPPPESVIQAITAAARQGNFYPGSAPDLRAKLGRAAGLGPENVILGNGSTDVINFVISAFVAPGEEVVIPMPTFSMYETRTRVNGGIPIDVPLGAPPEFELDVGAILAAITDRTKLIFLCTPNNPTGIQIGEEKLRRILETGIPTFIDEAYYELEEQPKTQAFLVKEFPNAIVNRTMSKAFGLAGLRVGYALADPDVVSYLYRVKIPWNVSLISIAAALAAVDDVEDQQIKRQTTLTGREYLIEQVNDIQGLKAFPSEGNFVLIDAGTLGKTSSEIRDDLISLGIFIRPMSSHHMAEGFVRVTVGTPDQNKHFIETFRTYIDQVRGKTAKQPGPASRDGVS